MILQMPTGKAARSIVDADARLNLWEGAVRSSKTVASILATLAFLATGPPGPFLFFAKTERTLRRNVIYPMQEILGANVLNCNWGNGEGRLWGRLLFLVGANDQRAEQKIRGATLMGAYGDELTTIPETFMSMLLTRLSVEGARAFFTTNPDSPLHWLKTGYVDRAAELGMRVFHFGLDDNPFLPRSFVAALKREHTGVWYKRFIEGAWVLAEGLVWDIDPQFHPIDALPPDVTILRHFVGVDYGTANPCVALLIGLGSDRRFYVMDEWRWDSGAQRRQKTDAEYSADLRAWIGAHGVTPTAWYVDPSAASFILQLRRDHGWNVVPADNEVGDGLRVVGTAISTDRLRILRPHCGALLTECGSYSWDPKKQLKGEDAPLKVRDHGPDALRYGLKSFIDAPIGGFLQWLEAKAAAAQAGEAA